MTKLDIALLVITGLVALSGLFEGFVLGFCATAGLVGGAAVGLFVLPHVLDHFSPGIGVAFAALTLMLICGIAGRALGAFIGVRIRRRLTWRPIRFLDGLFGAALAAASALVVLWALGVGLSGIKVPSISSAVRGSHVLRTVDNVIPGNSADLLRQFNRVTDTDLFPRFLEPFSPENIPSVAPPNDAVSRQPAIRAAVTRVVKINGVANSCSRALEGSGFVYATDRVMTNAHVVAGIASPKVQVGDKSYNATTVLYDPKNDIAVLKVPGLPLAPLSFDDTGKADDSGVVVGYPENGPLTTSPARIRRIVNLQGPDIYADSTVTRQTYSMYVSVRPGNSGGPLLSPEGKVYGVVFAASITDDNTGYALTAHQVSYDAKVGLGSNRAASTQSCT